MVKETAVDKCLMCCTPSRETMLILFGFFKVQDYVFKLKVIICVHNE